MSGARAAKAIFVLTVCGALGWALPAVASASSISGTVTAASGGAPIAGIQVCQYESKGTIEESCVQTDTAGGYTLSGLPAGSYVVSFSGDIQHLNYVNQRWNGISEGPGTPVVLGTGEARTGIDASMAEGASITGTVTDAESHAGVAGFPVCAFADNLQGEYGRCAKTDSVGQYIINGLPAMPNYQVEFVGEGEFNYRTQYYDGSEDFHSFTKVAVGAPNSVTSGIDAALNRGAEISGTLTEVGTHKPLAGLRVDLLAPGTEEDLKYVFTDAAGHYAFRGRPVGTYVVAFSRPAGQFDGDGFSTAFYRGVTAFAAATPLTISPPQVLTGIDGEVVNQFPHTGTPIQVTLVPVPRQLRCRHGFHKKKVRGKPHCVRVHKKRHHHHRHRRHAGG